ncbi:DUF4097 family beta strand repeat-containing protein [Fodinibius saliphilus]|uniref:DUF4097 family beta strand repeat-containing protein n=1 Tax=Fodinibius saliphilus TaxID=1920650 RepID=UPI001108D364|nr:DUF4097 family beta strand repeat-containing protein [Fodinibius saliphilus]
MNRRKITWEIVLAGLAFIIIGIYLADKNNTSEAPKNGGVREANPTALPKTSQPTDLPSSIIIDLKDLKNLDKLKELKKLKDLEHLEIDLNNINDIIDKKLKESDIEASLKKLEHELKQVEEANFDIKLQDKKVYINKDYNIEDSKWTEVKPGVYAFEKTFSASQLKSLNLNLAFGNINIIGTQKSTGKITLQATGTLEDPAVLSKQFVIKKQLDSPNAFFKIAPTESSNLPDKINLETTLSLPSTAHIDAQTAGGHVNASSLSGNYLFKTKGGHIELNTIDGNIEAKTQGGHITGNQLSGTMRLTTGGGHIKTTDVEGSLKAETGGGHIEITQLKGMANAKTSGGNITATVMKANGPIKLQSSAGNISLLLPENIKANLDISGSAIEMADLFNFNGTKNKGSISGTINGGGTDVVASCGFGNVNINVNK